MKQSDLQQEVVSFTFLNNINSIFQFIAFFRLKIQNVAFWLIAPTFASRAYFDNSIHERIDNLWRIHQNRVDRGNLSNKVINKL